MSYFNKVKEFHKKFELSIRESPYKELFDDKQLLNLRMKLIEEEYQELKEAVANKDAVEVFDAILDLHYVLSGFCVSAGLDEPTGFNLVHQSNMSKLCDTEEQAQETIEMYQQTRPQFVPSYRKTVCGTKWLVYDTLTGKVLKNKYYKPVDLSKFF
jgi:predicted HAD superfamily Cof-like phosphohydrolase